MRPRIALLSLALAATLGALALADEESAAFYAGRGDKALSAGDHGEAVEHYRRALKELDGYLPAHFGLAKALLARGDRDEGLATLRRAVAAADELDSTPAAWKSAIEDGRRSLRDLDAVGSALRDIEDGYVDELLGFARKWRKKDADVTEAALREVLVIRPSNAKAAEGLTEMGLSPSGVVRDLFDGTTFRGWTDMGPPTWQAKDGVIVATVHDAAYIGRTEQMFEGNFDVRLEARLVEEHNGPWMFALCPGHDGKDSHYSLGMLRGSIVWFDDFPGDQDDKERTMVDVSPSTLKGKFDRHEWNTFELQFRTREVIALVNGEEVGRDPRPEHRSRGFLGIKAQNCKVEFRAIRHLPR